MFSRHPAHLLIGGLLALAGVVFGIHHEIEAWPAPAHMLEKGSGTLRYVFHPRDGRIAEHWKLWLDQPGASAVQLVCRDGAPCPLFSDREALHGQRAQAAWASRRAFFSHAANEVYELRAGERQVLSYRDRYYGGGREKWILRSLCVIMIGAGLMMMLRRRQSEDGLRDSAGRLGLPR